MVFPGERYHDRPTSESAVRTALITMGDTPEVQTWHGFRATARTMLAEMDHPFAGGEPVYDITFENVQAGLRTDYLFRLANQRGGIVVGTGDLSALVRRGARAAGARAGLLVRGGNGGPRLLSRIHR